MKKTSLLNLNTRQFAYSIKGLLVAAMLTSFSGSTFAFTVIDPTHIGQSIINTTKETAEAYKQLQEAQKQLAEAKKMLAKLQGMTTAQVEMTDKLVERDINYQMDLYCPGAGNGVISALQGVLSLNPDGNTKEQQKKVCQNMVMAKNAQYNEAVKVLKMVKLRNADLKNIDDRRTAAINAGGEPGDIQAINLDYQNLATRMNIDMQYSNTVISAYAAYYSALETTQAQLGKTALTGDTGNKSFASTLVTKFVQGAVLETALQAARARER
jgi:hypothetical protein